MLSSSRIEGVFEKIPKILRIVVRCFGIFSILKFGMVAIAASQFNGLVYQAGSDFGGSPYCSYHVDLTNISQLISLSTDRLQVVASSISGNHKESGINGCTLTTLTPTNFQYIMTSQSVIGSNISIQYVSVSNPSFPSGIAIFTGIIGGSSISGVLEFKRTDQSSPLNWTVTTPVTLSVSATQVRPQVRFVYMVPNGLTVHQEYINGIRLAALDLQRWIWDQMDGSTFSIASPAVTVCLTQHTEDYYFLRPWDTVTTDLSQCVPWQYNDPNTRWVVYVDITPSCNSPNRIGAGTSGITIMDRSDLQGLSGAPSTVDTCGIRWNFPVGRWIGGMGHEFGHTLGLPHPPGCEDNSSTCDSQALMWGGYANYPNTYLRADEKSILKYNQFITPSRLTAPIKPSMLLPILMLLLD